MKGNLKSMALKLTISKKQNLLIFHLFYFLPFSMFHFYYFPLIKLPWSVNLPVLFITIVFCSLLAFFDCSRFFTFFDLQRFFEEISYYLLLSCVVCCFILVCLLFIMFFMCISFRAAVKTESSPRSPHNCFSSYLLFLSN